MKIRKTNKILDSYQLVWTCFKSADGIDMKYELWRLFASFRNSVETGTKDTFSLNYKLFFCRFVGFFASFFGCFGSSGHVLLFFSHCVVCMFVRVCVYLSFFLLNRWGERRWRWERGDWYI